MDNNQNNNGPKNLEQKIDGSYTDRTKKTLEQIKIEVNKELHLIITSLNDRDYQQALNSIIKAENMYLSQKLQIPQELLKLRRNAYAIGVYKEIENLRYGINTDNYQYGIDSLANADICLKRLGIQEPPPLEISRKKIYNIGILKEIDNAKSALNADDFEDAYDSLDKIELFSKYLKKELPGYHSRLKELAKELMLKKSIEDLYDMETAHTPETIIDIILNKLRCELKTTIKDQNGKICEQDVSFFNESSNKYIIDVLEMYAKEKNVNTKKIDEFRNSSKKMIN